MKKKSKKIIPKTFILDVDGVLNTGQFLYSKTGKVMKIFGPDDNDALSLLKPYMKIIFVSGDKKGFAITKKRIVRELFDKIGPFFSERNGGYTRITKLGFRDNDRAPVSLIELVDYNLSDSDKGESS